jgi:parallel beta-helix repeat protein
MGTGYLHKIARKLAIIAVGLAWAVSARASIVNCGDILTADTVLSNSLLDCIGDGLIIGADNITVDLNGQVLKGSGSPGFVGIRITDRSGVIVKGPGVVERFDGGIEITGGGNNVVKGVTVANDNNNAACLPVVPPGPRGIAIVNSVGNLVKENVAVNNCRGFVVVGPASQGNRLTGNSAALNFFFGILVRNGAHDNEIKSNSLTGNSGPGVSLAQNVSQNEVRENFVSGNAIGMTLLGSADNNRLKENVIVNNGAIGILLGFDVSPFPAVSDNDGNQIRENVIGNQTTGVLVQDPSSDGNLIEENRFFNVLSAISDLGTATTISGNLGD